MKSLQNYFEFIVPFRLLSQSGIVWFVDKTQIEALEKLKVIIMSSPELQFYEPNLTGRWKQNEIWKRR